MAKVLCNLITKKPETYSRWDNISHDPETHVQIDIDYVPDMENERLNDTNDGLRPITQAEIDAENEIKKTKEAQQLSSSPQMQAAIEEFVSVLQAASIPVPADISTNIINRCKAKL